MGWMVLQRWHAKWQDNFSLLLTKSWLSGDMFPRFERELLGMTQDNLQRTMNLPEKRKLLFLKYIYFKNYLCLCSKGGEELCLCFFSFYAHLFSFFVLFSFASFFIFSLFFFAVCILTFWIKKNKKIIGKKCNLSKVQRRHALGEADKRGTAIDGIARK